MRAFLKPTLALTLFAVIAGNLRFSAADPAAKPSEQAPRATITDSIGLKLVEIPAGEFMMGSHESLEEMQKTFTQYEPRRFNHTDEYPLHKVRITRPFEMGIYPVTIGQFMQFVKTTDYKTDADRDDPSLDTPGEPRRT